MLHIGVPLPAQVRSYIFELEKHLGEAHRQASRLVRHQAELGAAVQEFGTAMITLGRFEEAVSEARHRRKGRAAAERARWPCCGCFCALGEEAAASCVQACTPTTEWSLRKRTGGQTEGCQQSLALPVALAAI